MKRLKIKKENFLYFLLVITVIFAIWPWFKEGVPYTDDFRHHIAKFWWVKYSFENYGKYVDWMPYIYSGWPMAHFYHSLPYFISLPFILLTNPVSALKISIVVSFILSAFSMFFAVKKLLNNKEIAVISSIFYLLAPIHFEFAYISGSLSRLWAYIFVPLVIVYFIKSIEDGSKKNVLLLAVTFAALIYANINIAFAISLVFLVYMAYYFLIKEKKIELSKLKNIFYAAVITIGLLSFWFFPMIIEKESSETTKFVSVFGGSITETSYKSVFTRSFGIDKNNNLRYFYIGFSLIAFAGISFLIKKFEYRNIFVFLAILGIILATNTWILKFIPFAHFILYSHYFILISTAFLSILAAASIYSLSKLKKKYSLLIIVLALTIFLIDIYPAQSKYHWTNLTDESYANNKQILEAYAFVKTQPDLFRVYSFIGEVSFMYTEKPEIGLEWTGYREGAFKPIRKVTDEIFNAVMKNVSNSNVHKILGYMGTKYEIYPCISGLNETLNLKFSNNLVCVYENPFFTPVIDSPRKILKSDEPLVLESNLAILLEKCDFDCLDEVNQTKISDIKFKADLISFKTNGPGYVLVKSAYFKPHWHAYINGKETEIKLAWPHYMLINVPSGENEVKFKYENNLNHTLGWIVSFLTIVLIIIFLNNKLNFKKLKNE